jgi:hypothetical protein
MLDFIMTASGWTNPCPRKPGAAQWLLRHKWFVAATARLFEDGDAVPLDG